MTHGEVDSARAAIEKLKDNKREAVQLLCLAMAHAEGGSEPSIRCGDASGYFGLIRR